MKKIFIIGLALLAVGCSDDEEARRQLTNAGYKAIQTSGYAFSGCGQDDTVQTGFEAQSPGGQWVEGVVCCGFGPFAKGCTIRTF
jgi:hypothetical protein